MQRHHIAYVLICSVSSFAFFLTLERMHTPIPTTSELQAAYQYGVWQGKDTPPQPFVFDGCTLFPDSVLGTSFRQACLQHDIAYWYGGTTAERAAADQTFRETIADQGIIGTILHTPMYASIRLFGDTALLRPINANWGFGYNATK